MTRHEIRAGVSSVRTEERAEGSAIHRARASLVSVLEACGAFEWVALSYLGLSGLLMILFYKNLPHATRLLAIHAGFIVAICALVVSARLAALGVHRREQWARILWAIRDWYPQLVFLFCFEELGALMHLIHRGWMDSWLLALDYRLLGTYPVVWLAQIAKPGLTEFMQLAYLTYFFYLTILALLLYFRGPDSRLPRGANHSEFWTVMTCSMAAYAIGYIISIFFPIESPYFSLAALHLAPLRGGPATFFSDLIEHFGRVHGGAFPSEHVAGSFVALLGAWRYRRRLFWIFLPFFVCMCVSTVYVRNHYIADVFAGIVTGAIGFQIGLWLMRLPGAIPVKIKN
jgi:membrane-associated phospholipid phosphatase